MTVQNLVLEGTDMIGKTTVFHILRGILPNKISDRKPDFSKCIGLTDVSDVLQSVVDNNAEDLHVVLYTNDNTLLETRLDERQSNQPHLISTYDVDTVKYNIVYKKALHILKDKSNVVGLCVDGKTPFTLVSEILSIFLQKYVDALPEITLEGESKIYRRIPNTNMALVSLKPTLYSFTYNRYGEVPGTDVLRYKFWTLFATQINNEYTKQQASVFNEMHILPSSFLTTFTLGGKDYSVVRFWDKISPLEVVWKNYLVGTMKHNLKGVDTRQTRYGSVIEYEGKLPASLIRFDWRNDLPDKDECIPDEFAEFYIDTKVAKKTANYVTDVLRDMLSAKGYELIDLCYFMTYDGNQVCGEISPDGMRIRKKGQSYDKDLWRTGKDKAELCEIWEEMYTDLCTTKF